MRRILGITVVLVAAIVVGVAGTGAGDDSGGAYRVRAIFDNAFSLIEGEDVRVAGVNVGKISALDVTEDNRAAVVLEITDPHFQDFRSDASCSIRPQSLIGEKYVECSLTEPRGEGEDAPAALETIPDGEPGAGERLLPVERTSKPVDVDLINNVMRLPQRQRLAIILNELGAAVAGRGDDLNETIRRANPALGATNEVLEIIGEQNKVLRALARDSDAILAPLARDREQVADFIVQADDVSRATAERRADFEASLQRLPRFLQELRPTMQRLGGLSDEMTPVLGDLQAVAPDVNRFFKELGPFAEAGIPAVESLGDALEIGRPALVRSKPIVDDLRALTTEARPLAKDLRGLAVSLRDSGGIERLMDYLFYQVAAVNGFDSLGHYLRAGLIVNTCTTYSVDPAPGCSARFASEADARNQSARAAANDPASVRAFFSRRAKTAGEDHSAQARRPSGGARGKRAAGAPAEGPVLRMPSALLPGQAPEPQDAPGAAEQQQPEQGRQEAEQGLLDYLLGDGS
jgi:ABC-type transporter Mla subunit MlaD